MCRHTRAALPALPAARGVVEGGGAGADRGVLWIQRGCGGASCEAPRAVWLQGERDDLEYLRERERRVGSGAIAE